MANVFISYSHKDKEFVQILNEILRKSNQDTWVDWQDIPSTEDWLMHICSMIETTTTFVFIISPDSVVSKFCHQEINHALKYNKRIVPVVRRDIDTKAIHPALTKLKWIFFRESDNSEIAFQTLITAINTKSL